MGKTDCRRDLLIVGRITAPQGLQGAVRVQSLTDERDRFLALSECRLLAPDETEIGLVTVSFARPHKGDQVILQFKGYTDRPAADSLRGCLLAVDRAHAVRLPADRWFICDLIGCEVYDDRNGCLGTLQDILQHTAQDVYVVRQQGKPDLLFPALKTILREVDIPGRRIDVHLPDGLFEVYREG